MSQYTQDNSLGYIIQYTVKPIHIATIDKSKDTSEQIIEKLKNGFEKYAEKKVNKNIKSEPLQYSKEYDKAFESLKYSKKDIEIAEAQAKDKKICDDHNDYIKRMREKEANDKNGFKQDQKIRDDMYTSAKKDGMKHNQTKLEMSRLFEQFPKALQALVLSSHYGANKYKEQDIWDNFRKVAGGSKTYLDALQRHVVDGVGNTDQESGLPHIFHCLWNVIAATELWIEENNIDIKEFSKNYLVNLK